jgi:hypothetical protein
MSGRAPTLDFLGPMVQNPAHDDESQPSAGP